MKRYKSHIGLSSNCRITGNSPNRFIGSPYTLIKTKLTLLKQRKCHVSIVSVFLPMKSSVFLMSTTQKWLLVVSLIILHNPKVVRVSIIADIVIGRNLLNEMSVIEPFQNVIPSKATATLVISNILTFLSHFSPDNLYAYPHHMKKAAWKSQEDMCKIVNSLN